MEIDREIFSMVIFSPSTASRRPVVSYWGKYRHLVPVNHLVGHQSNRKKRSFKYDSINIQYIEYYILYIDTIIHKASFLRKRSSMYDSINIQYIEYYILYIDTIIHKASYLRFD